ncbi:MAG: carboxylating nicotinate-nucleotide diphosphorylase [Ignavibacteriales bacterium]|jgi:nicotinate-nucleotide pyrophosphorylase (carboxylating)|nr:carboxylating nicotinate-nucleotide diphosphorylase [Ignavibacteriaceae bacterium]NLH60980.1 carboxylating nicotinate-nucleotide diphosphorylase [Ignavibacteriales bacterium]
MKTYNYDGAIVSALEEDIQNGDITTSAILINQRKAFAEFLVKECGIIAGVKVCERVFLLKNSELEFESIIEDGTQVKEGKIIATVKGDASSILQAERTALNFLQRMSGIATITNKFVKKIKHTKAKILDTRKTVPGLRHFDKLAVKLGGGENHRFGLYDMFLIKDNHIEVAGSITEAIEQCRDYQNRNKTNYKIEVEVKNLNEIEEALKCNVEIIMLDNFSTGMMKEAVKLVNGRCLTEASGGITLENVAEVAETGVDFVSTGAITHSVKGLDISLMIRHKIND